MRPIGLQLYTLRRSFEADPMGTLSRIRESGYDAVEFAAPLDLDYQALGAHLRSLGLDCPSAHVGLADMAERPDAVFAMAEDLGARYLVLPFLLPEQRRWRDVASSLMRFADLSAPKGFRVAYHHHDFEFGEEAGERPFDILLAETDPTKVWFELDTFWLDKAGQDVRATIERLAGRVRLIHLKDMGPDGWMADVGSGSLNFPELIAASDAAGVEHFLVEHDRPPEPYWSSVEASLAYLRSIT